MSLDVYLFNKVKLEAENCVCEYCGSEYIKPETVVHSYKFETNITHNLGEMAKHCGLYDIVWRPEENGIFYASDIISKLKKGIDLLKSNPDEFKKYNSPNGWGKYEDFLSFLEEYLQACIDNPLCELEALR